MKRFFICFFIICFILIGISGCGSSNKKLPLPQADETSIFGIDKNINMSTIDKYLTLENVIYRDVRMLFDPADYESIGGEANLTRTIKGFKIVPYPYIASLSQLPVSGAYEGESLYSLIWNEDGSIKSVRANFKESGLILDELFPKDKTIFIMCGGGGYAGMMKSLLIFLGWDETLIYNIGANWEYEGENRLELVVYPENANETLIYATWRADYAYIDFEKLKKV